MDKSFHIKLDVLDSWVLNFGKGDCVWIQSMPEQIARGTRNRCGMKWVILVSWNACGS
jgi:hypothetical protein